MKKFLTAVTLLFSFSVFEATAELRPYKRFFEVGVDADVHATQNTMGITELLVKDLVINFNEMSNKMDEDGLVVDGGVNPEFFMNFNFGEHKGFGIYTDVDFHFRFGTGKGLFDFLGKGNPETNFGTTFSLQSDAFLQVGVPVKMKIKDYGVKVTPVYYTPLFYVPRVELRLDASSDTAKTLYAFGETDFEVYSCFNLRNGVGEKFSVDAGGIASAMASDIAGILSSGGISLNLEVERKVFATLEAGIYANVPVTAGHLKYKTKGHASFEAHVDPVLDGFSDSEKKMDFGYDYDYSLGETEDASYAVRLPFKLGMEGVWRPFGDWCMFRPKLGFAVRNPFGKDFSKAHNVYTEYGIGIETEIFYVLGLGLSSSYEDQVFKQAFNLKINTRVVEIDVSVASASTDFGKSWTLSGLNGKVGVVVGF